MIAREQANAATLARHLAEFAPDIAVLGPMGGAPIGIAHQLRLARGSAQLAFVFDDWPDYYLKADAWQRRLKRLGPLGAAAGAPPRAARDASRRPTSTPG